MERQKQNIRYLPEKINKNCDLETKQIEQKFDELAGRIPRNAVNSVRVFEYLNLLLTLPLYIERIIELRSTLNHSVR